VEQRYCQDSIKLSHLREDYTWRELLVTSEVAERPVAGRLKPGAVNGWRSDLTYISADQGVQYSLSASQPIHAYHGCPSRYTYR
jgi:hypothetical protein